MLDKNPDKISLVGISKAKECLNEDTLSSVLCSEPFVKAAFLSKLIKQIDVQIIYLDFDLLYSGYVNSGMLYKDANVSLFAPSKDNWNQTLKKILLMVLDQKSVIIIDSLNGLYNLFDRKDVGRLVNTYIMLLVFVAKESSSSVLFSSMVRKEEEEWVLSPTGRHIIDIKMTTMYLKKFNSKIVIKVIDNDQTVVDSI